MLLRPLNVSGSTASLQARPSRAHQTYVAAYLKRVESWVLLQLGDFERRRLKAAETGKFELQCKTSYMRGEWRRANLSRFSDDEVREAAETALRRKLCAVGFPDAQLQICSVGDAWQWVVTVCWQAPVPMEKTEDVDGEDSDGEVSGPALSEVSSGAVVAASDQAMTQHEVQSGGGALGAVIGESNRFCDVQSLSDALSEGHTILVEGDWFIQQADHGGRFLRRQEMEINYPEAVLSHLGSDQICRASFTNDGKNFEFEGGATLIVAISYPWLAPHHPDEDGQQLKLIARMLRWIRPLLQGRDVAVFVDHLCLYQKKRMADQDDWSDEQASKFKDGLKAVNLWYSHKFVHVWALTDTTASERPYMDRGWCYFEYNVSLLNSRVVLNLRECTGCGEMPLMDMRITLREAVLPDEFDTAILSKTFTAGADKDYVKAMYRKAFEAMFSDVTTLDLSSMAWTDGPLIKLLRQLPYPEKMQSVDISYCDSLTDETASCLADGCKKLQCVHFYFCSKFTDKAAKYLADGCKNLQRVSFGACYSLTDEAAKHLADGCKNFAARGLLWLQALDGQGSEILGARLREFAGRGLQLLWQPHGQCRKIPGAWLQKPTTRRLQLLQQAHGWYGEKLGVRLQGLAGSESHWHRWTKPQGGKALQRECSTVQNYWAAQLDGGNHAWWAL